MVTELEMCKHPQNEIKIHTCTDVSKVNIITIVPA